MEEQKLDTTQPFNVYDVDGDATVTARRRFGYVTVGVGGNTFASGLSQAWLSSTDARKLAGFLMIAADEAEAMYGPTVEGHRDIRPTIITPQPHGVDTDTPSYVVTCRRCDHVERFPLAMEAILAAVHHDDTHKPTTDQGQL